MTPRKPVSRPRRALALRVAIAYAAAGALWIAYSDWILAGLIADPAQLTEFQSYKGWLFIALTAFLLYLLLRMPAPGADDVMPPERGTPGRAWPLRWQLLVLSLVVAAPLVSLMGYNLYRSFEQDKHAAGTAALHLARITAANTEVFLDDARRILETLAQRPAVLALDRKTCDPLLTDILRLHPRFRNALTVDRNGELVCSAVALPPGAPTRADPNIVFNLLRESMQFTIGTPAIGFIAQRWVVPLVYPLRDARGEFIGTVALPVDLVNYPVLPATVSLPEGAVLAISSYSGMVIARTPDAENFVGKSTLNSPIRVAALAAKTGQIEEAGLDGIRRIYGFTAIPGTDWYALAGLPAKAVYADSRAAFVRSVLLTLAILLLVAVGAFAIARRIDRPLRRIAGVADAIAAGDRAARAPLAGSRETVALAAQFNAMLETLDASERQFRETLKNVQLIAVALDAQGQVTYCNDFLLKLSGWQREEVLGRDWFETFLPDPAPVRAMFEQSIRDGNLPLHYENAIVTRQGARRLIRWNNTILRDPANRIIGTVSLGEDITEHRRAEEQVRELLAKEQRAGAVLLNLLEDQKQSAAALQESVAHLHKLTRRLLEVEESERRKINRELHDRIGQNLSALNLILGMIGSQLPAGALQELGARFDDARKLLEVTSQQVRDVMADLRPAALDEYGLFAALRTYAEPWARRIGVPVTVDGEDLAPRPPPATEIALFRIAQEALANTAKHARAHHVNVTLAATPSRASLTVTDDGVGFNPEKITGSPLHWGMATMRERAEAIGATLRVESAPGKGTRVVVEAPRQEA